MYLENNEHVFSERHGSVARAQAASAARPGQRERLNAMRVEAHRGAALGAAHVAGAGARVERQRRRVILQHVPIHTAHALRHRHLCMNSATDNSPYWPANLN